MVEINDLENEKAFAKMKEIAKSVSTCMFCTKLSSTPFNARPMSVGKVDEDGKFWFMSSSKSNKNMEIQQNDNVQLIFSDPAGSRFMSVYGESFPSVNHTPAIGVQASSIDFLSVKISASPYTLINLEPAGSEKISCTLSFC